MVEVVILVVVLVAVAVVESNAINLWKMPTGLMESQVASPPVA